MNPCVYLLASKKNGTLYIGVTSNLVQRIWQHREGLAEGFTKKYNVKTLVWYEQHATMESAITREKALKKWNRAWKLDLIEKTNPQWHDLWLDILGATESQTTTQRHSREGGNPEVEAENLDSRLRGNDEADGKNSDQEGFL
ncbi:hypothetical protein A1353_01630 [Methylomonas methanica]|uniref:GIY-YIG domain-containing protein n=1 Tax=Methylomonas methanica TaxID=421 RepID=A0A177M454_METMH|nr:GIY-YIG nuclease family protein [Methylomonas methanica]OAI00421.1 hypothetical protein A1353_01630 [Methylomonas methanica]